MKRKIAILIAAIIGIFFIVAISEKSTVNHSPEGKILGENTSEPGATPRSQPALVIMTFNAELLWDGVLPEEGRLEFPWKGNKEKAEAHMEKVAQVIRQENPDIVNLVEVENISALNTFNEKFLKDFGYHAYLVTGRDTYTGEDVALLTKIEPEGGKIYRDDREGRSSDVRKSVSKNYYAYFRVDGLKFVLIGIHFLAEPLNRQRVDERQAQADAIRSLAQEFWQEGYQVAVVGDFNDYDGDPNCLDQASSIPITRVMADIRAMDNGTPLDDLVNVAYLIPNTERYTAFYEKNSNGKIDALKEFTSIDHILLSQGLASRVDSAQIPHAYDPREVSDHFPVIVKLKIERTP